MADSYFSELQKHVKLVSAPGVTQKKKKQSVSELLAAEPLPDLLRAKDLFKKIDEQQAALPSPSEQTTDKIDKLDSIGLVDSVDIPDIASQNQPVIQPVIQPDTQPDTPPDVQPVSPTPNQSLSPSAVEPAIQPDSQPVIQPDTCPVIPPVIQPDFQPISQLPVQPLIHPVVQPYMQPVDQSVIQPVIHPDIQPIVYDDFISYSLTKSQCLVLLYLAQQPGLAQRQKIASATKLPLGTVKDALNTLNRKGYICSEYFVRGGYRGISFKIDTALFNDFLQRRGTDFNTNFQPVIPPHIQPHNQPLSQPVYQPVFQPITRPLNQPLMQSVNQTVNHPLSQPVVQPLDSSFSSSSENQKTTTTVLTGPEMAYWVELGLKDRQVLKWCEDFNIDPSEIRQQLAWARWDLVNNDKEAEVKKDAINWFFGILKRSAGCYPPAKGYQSPVEIRAARLRAQIDAEVKARADLDTLEVEARFQAVLNNPEGAEYQNLLSGLPEAMSGMKGKTLETILREKFLAREG
jgi:hypothetical protein